MENSPKKMHSAYPVGMLCVVEKPCLHNRPNALALIVEHYKLGEHHGVTALFENGNYDGFSHECAEIFSLTPVKFLKKYANYEFTTAVRLSNEYQSGLFKNAFTREVK